MAFLYQTGAKTHALRARHAQFDPLIPKSSFSVIPGRELFVIEPGIRNHRRDYGFRACAKWRIPE